ncbi:unnamed protein product [Lota lota]
MTSRRPVTRSYSGNGRTSSFEEEGSSSNRESRNTYLSNVRPENRSTLCSVMAQLTEDIQPSFETTLKSKAVSENCNVKFTCVVTGYPAPELTWYKDDIQMDRYCGLPKYEIHRNGKNHTLQIYNCTLDDAAIYQASASNSRGIVSCSGVLEVGTMSEFLIHQRFFAKLKQKAESKRKELENSKKKENVQKEQSEGSPQRFHGKRPGPPPPSKEEPHAVEQIGAAAPEPNGASAGIEEAAPQTPTGVGIEEMEDSDPSSKDNVATKKIKISNGLDGVTGSGSSGRGRAIANGRQNSYDGGISLAQFLAETVSSQAVEEKQVEETCEMDTSVQGLNEDDAREKEATCTEAKEGEMLNIQVQEHERLRVSQIEIPVEREKERERQPELQRPKIPTVTLPVPTVETQTSPTRVLPRCPQTQTLACGEASSPATLSCRMLESTPICSVAFGTDILEAAASEVPGDQRLHADTTVETGPLEPQDNHPPDYPLMSQQVEAQAEIQTNETRMETGLLAPALEDQIVFDSACMNQVPIPIITIQADNPMVSDSMEMDYTPLSQTTNIEALSAVTTVDISEKGDFNMQQGGLPDGFESPPGCNLSVSPTSAMEQNEDIVPLQEGLTSAFDQKNEVTANLKPEELPLSEIESDEKTRETSRRYVGLTLGIESEFERGKEGEAFAEVQEDLNESWSLPGARNEEVTVRLSEAAIVVANPDDTGHRWVLENVPESETLNYTFEDTTDIKAIIPQKVSNEKIIKTGNEVKEPEIKEPVLPLITLTSITKPQIVQKDRSADISKVTLKDNNAILVSKTHSLLPKETSLLNEDDNPPTDKAQEVVQLHDKTETQHAAPHSIFSAQVSEDPTLPVSVVPPISITCDDVPVETISVPSQHQHTVTGLYQGGATHAESLIALESPAQVRTLNGALTPAGATADVLSPIKTTAAVGDAVTCKKKPRKGDEKEPDAPGSEHAKDRPLQPDKLPVERLDVKARPTHAALSPASLRRFLSRAGPRSDSPTATAVPAITVEDSPSDQTGGELSGGSTPTSSLSCESSPRLKRRDSLSLIRSATPEELASGARRKIFMPRAKGEDGGEGAAGLGVSGAPETVAKRESPYMSPGQARRAALLQAPAGQNTPGVPEAAAKRESPYMSPGQARRAALLQAPAGQNTPPMERRSPLLNRRKAMLEVPKVVEEKPAEEPDSSKSEEKPAEKEKLDPFKAPQVIRKIRGESFPDASGHLKLWCQFFNILSDSTVKWYRDEVEILELKRSGGDESQVALAIVQASSPDCGVYGCTITNEYGTDSTDFLLSVDILSDMLLKEDLEVGEEIEMTPLRFTKGLADVSCWGDKFFGRIMTKVSHVGEGCAHKACRIKVIYGLDPVFESGSTCIVKVQSPIPYGTKEERNLAERNLEMTKQECKIQNMIREYCKIFAAEARVVENFGFSLEVLPQYLMYRPANSVPYATVETDLPGVFLKYCTMDAKGRLITRTSSEVEQKCCTFQHWIHQWTHGNLLVTNLQGVETKLTNIRVATKSKGFVSARMDADVCELHRLSSTRG